VGVLVRQCSDLTLTGAFLGTPSYAAPEQVRGRKVGLQADIYSVGATLYALLTGSAPFHGSNAGEVLARIVGEAPTPFAQYPGRIPRTSTRHPQGPRERS
jgi:serine/threonine protein kinase